MFSIHQLAAFHPHIPRPHQETSATRGGLSGQGMFSALGKFSARLGKPVELCYLRLFVITLNLKSYKFQALGFANSKGSPGIA